MPSIESIELHLRTYRSALKSNLEVTVHSLTNSYLKMGTILHPLASDPTKIDPSAIVYSLLRLPKNIDKAKSIVMGQDPKIFADSGLENVLSWKKSPAKARRRSYFFNPKTSQMASFISSVSDIDDLVNLAIAYQIEWNKFHNLVTTAYPKFEDFKNALKSKEILNLTQLSPSDWDKIVIALGRHWRLRLKRVYKAPRDLRLRLLAGNWIDYTKSTQQWWISLTNECFCKRDLSQSRLYFVSSNSHSLKNIISGFPIKSEKLLQKFTPKNYQATNPYLEHRDFLYYLSRLMTNNSDYQNNYQKYLHRLGILTPKNNHYMDINAQVYPINSLTKSAYLDPRLTIKKRQKISQSQAIIFNIDYPLGFAAYHILSKFLENINHVVGVYILGKAAVLNSEIGDIQIPRLVFDEQSQNSYIFKNVFNTFFPFNNRQGSILTNQKSVSVLGTFLENDSLLRKYSQNDLTVIEMESGPYLSAVTEATYDTRTPQKTLVDLNSAPFELGIINYTSDTPYSQAKNLGAGSLALSGVEPVYLGSLAILQRIINLEESLD
ncbi:MAG: hypothetical protein AAGU06_03025 [Candidatus Shapirobacteria bacterium]